MNRDAPFASFDDRVDRLVEPIRNVHAAVLVFMVASAVGDFGLLWHAIGLIRAIGSVDRFRDALVFSSMIGIESLLLNQGIKRFFRRTRPTERGDDRISVRTPSTSSFPSGHASSAFFSALVLTYWVTWPWMVLFYLIAIIIAISRIGARIHHASDVLAGAITGTLLGVIGLVVLSKL
ncbi:MAG: phosphatase PAP2 family protein [Ilumatobacteraceae bacterium]